MSLTIYIALGIVFAWILYNIIVIVFTFIGMWCIRKGKELEWKNASPEERISITCRKLSRYYKRHDK